MSSTIAFQGAPGAFSHQAALAFSRALGGDGEVVSSGSFAEVFERVTTGKSQYGAIPLENSSMGSIVANYDLLWTNDAVIVGEHFLPVHHHLIGHEGTDLHAIEKVYSHPAALDQCRRLFKSYPNMKPTVFWDTSASVRHVRDSGERTSAAIAGEPAAREYEMTILVPNVEDFPHNATRFGLIAASRADVPAALSTAVPAALSTAVPAAVGAGNGAFKMSWAMELAHQPGTLSALLQSLSTLGANLTKIESRPIGETPWHYRFFIDMEVPAGTEAEEIVAVIAKHSTAQKLLGRYQPALRNA